MSKSGLLRSRELRQAHQLAGECREPGHDPLAWNRRLVDGLHALLGAVVGATMELRPHADGQWGGVFGVDAGWASAAQRAFWFEHYIANDGFRRAITYQRCMALPGRHVTRCRQQLVSDAEWDRSFEFNETRRPMGLDGVLASLARLKDPPAVYGFVLNRPTGDPGFGPRECRLAHLVLQHLAQDLRRGLALCPGGIFVALPERLQATLRCLLEGDSERQTALRLELSRSTIHEYITDLYRHFGVSGRAELLARCYRHCGPILPPERGGAQAHLPRRLRETLRCMLDGDSEKQAALRLKLSRHTIHEYVTDLYRLLGVNSRTELVVQCYRSSQPSADDAAGRTTVRPTG